MADQLMTDDTPTADDRPTGEAFLGTYDEDKKSPMNLMAWIQGVRPIRRAVVLYQRLDLLADRDELAEQLKEARLMGDPEAEQLAAQIRGLTDEIRASSMRVVLAGVTKTRFREILEEARVDRTVVTAEDVVIYQVAAQVVEPEGFTYATLKELDDLLPVQANRLATAWEQINSTVPDVEATVPL